MHVMDRFGLSERKACRLVELNRSSKQYKPSKRDDSEIRARIRELAEKHKKYGSPMIHAILRREGYVLNHKKTERIYREERLSLRKKVRRKLPARARVPMERATRVNEVWSMDFVSDSLAGGRKCQREDKSIPILGMKSIPPLPDSVLRIDPVLRDFSP